VNQTFAVIVDNSNL